VYVRKSLHKSMVVLALLAVLGCGTTRMTDTKRSATEQLLISDAMDRAISRLDFRALAGKPAYLDADPTRGVADREYLVSAMRQHMLASGCVLKDKREEADYVVELRVGAVGTDRHEVLFGVPATKVPEAVSLVGVPSSIPELPLAKKTEQRAVTKLAVFAYNQETGRPVWQSGVIPVESKAKDVWVFGAGPFQRGTIYEGTKFAGQQLKIPLIEPGRGSDGEFSPVPVAAEAYFVEPNQAVADEKGASDDESVPQVARKDTAPKQNKAPPSPAGKADAVPPRPEPPKPKPKKKAAADPAEAKPTKGARSSASGAAKQTEPPADTNPPETNRPNPEEKPPHDAAAAADSLPAKGKTTEAHPSASPEGKPAEAEATEPGRFAAPTTPTPLRSAFGAEAERPTKGETPGDRKPRAADPGASEATPPPGKPLPSGDRSGPKPMPAVVKTKGSATAGSQQPAPLPVDVPEPTPLDTRSLIPEPSRLGEVRATPMLQPDDDLPPIPAGLNRLRFQTVEGLLDPPQVQ
jgi:hypothetical protein